MTQEDPISDLSVTRLAAGLDRVRGESAQVDGGVTRARADITKLRGDSGAGGSAPARAAGDATDVRGDLTALRGDLVDFRGTVNALGSGALGAKPSAASRVGSDAAGIAQQSSLAVASGGLKATGAEATVNSLSDALSGLQRATPKS